MARIAYWVDWWQRFGPASGSEPKPDDPFDRYVITTFVKGTHMGPYEAARHIPGVSGHELAYTANRHFFIVLLNEAIADLVNAHARLDISQAWGDGTTVAADGTHMDTYLDNLLAETSVRYGKPGGVAYHHISDTYVALFTHFIPCGVWEAVYIIEGLLKNSSEVKPTTVHADTQGQSQPVFALAHLLGFDLMPRIRNWKGLTFYRPSKTTEYLHIDALFGESGKNVIDWDLIESQFRHLMKVAVSVREGAISSSTLLKRLRSGSKKNARHPARRVRPEAGRRLHPAPRPEPGCRRLRPGRLTRPYHPSAADGRARAPARVDGSHGPIWCLGEQSPRLFVVLVLGFGFPYEPEVEGVLLSRGALSPRCSDLFRAPLLFDSALQARVVVGGRGFSSAPCRMPFVDTGSGQVHHARRPESELVDDELARL
ncbi:Tn3 family transposase [Streptomyces sp. NPDC007369]|uniref:Tn3 family transposase n=1 Tax=Streptomyces sp. NPDC007369 TaxID=3154589 RepID=UPI0033CEF3BD